MDSLHLGNAVNFLLARWVADAEPGSRVDLRIDDLGLPVRPDHLADVFWALDWLGIPISAGPVDPDDFWRAPVMPSTGSVPLRPPSDLAVDVRV